MICCSVSRSDLRWVPGNVGNGPSKPGSPPPIGPGPPMGGGLRPAGKILAYTTATSGFCAVPTATLTSRIRVGRPFRRTWATTVAGRGESPGARARGKAATAGRVGTPASTAFARRGRPHRAASAARHRPPSPPGAVRAGVVVVVRRVVVVVVGGRSSPAVAHVVVLPGISLVISVSVVVVAVAMAAVLVVIVVVLLGRRRRRRIAVVLGASWAGGELALRRRPLGARPSSTILATIGHGADTGWTGLRCALWRRCSAPRAVSPRLGRRGERQCLGLGRRSGRERARESERERGGDVSCCDGRGS